MAEPPDCHRSPPPRRGGRRIRDNPVLARAFDTVLLAISDQVYGLQGRHNLTLQRLVDASGLSDRGLLDIFKTRSDPKISTLVRLAECFGCELQITFRPRPSGTPLR